MVIVDVVAEAVGLIAAKYFYDKVERKEQACPPCAEPTTKERSNKLKSRKFNFCWEIHCQVFTSLSLQKEELGGA